MPSNDSGITLIIPDIHCMYAEAEAIISKVKPNLTIFLGDYFDRYDNDPTLTQQVATWLKGSIEKKDRIHLLGNHELFYVSGNESMICSGNTRLKRSTIVQTGIDWSKFHLHYWLDDWLITHAGFSKAYYDEYKKDCLNPNADPKEFIGFESREAKRELLKGEYHRLFSVSFSRGGYSDVAGTLWCDFREFQRISEIKQLFGHTHYDKPYISVDGRTIDLDSTGYYAVYENKKMKVLSS